MAKSIRCECGYVASAATADELIADVQRHAREAHRMELTWEQVQAMIPPE
jgi:predicted small metal-binding protein